MRRIRILNTTIFGVDISKLQPRPRKFLECWLTNGGKLADAYRRAYDPARGADAVSHARGLISTNPIVRAVIDAARRQSSARLLDAAERYSVTPEKISAELAKIAFSDMRDYADLDVTQGFAALHDLPEEHTAPIQQFILDTTAAEGVVNTRLRFRLYSKIQALDTLARIAAMVKADDGAEEGRYVVVVKGGLPLEKDS